MNKSEEAYCKHDLNVLFGETEYYNFYPTKTELQELSEYAKTMKDYLLHNKSDCPCDKFSSDGKILYTENLFHTINYHGFIKIAKLLGDYNCIALNGFEGACDVGILQIGDIFSYDTDAFYFEGFPILSLLQEKYGYWNVTDEVERDNALKLAKEEYSNFIDEELRFARWMGNLGVNALVNIYSVVEI